MDRREFIFKRKNRCVGQLLHWLERIVFEGYDVSEADREAVRRVVKDKVGSYHRDVIDLLKNTDQDTRINDMAVQIRDRQHDHRPTQP